MLGTAEGTEEGVTEGALLGIVVRGMAVGTLVVAVSLQVAKWMQSLVIGSNASQMQSNPVSFPFKTTLPKQLGTLVDELDAIYGHLLLNLLQLAPGGVDAS